MPLLPTYYGKTRLNRSGFDVVVTVADAWCKRTYNPYSHVGVASTSTFSSRSHLTQTLTQTLHVKITYVQVKIEYKNRIGIDLVGGDLWLRLNWPIAHPLFKWHHWRVGFDFLQHELTIYPPNVLKLSLKQISYSSQMSPVCLVNGFTGICEVVLKWNTRLISMSYLGCLQCWI